jgi:large subunit ribosomal protein L6
MSRIGKEPVAIPSGVDITLNDGQLTVKGPKGTLTQPIHPDIDVAIEESRVVVTRPSDQREHRSLHGLVRALIQNMVVGVTEGYQRNLDIVGVGYRAQARGTQGLTIQVGYSHNVEFDAPEGIEFAVPTPTKIEIRGNDKQVVGQVAANIRAIRKPEPYKGKGIRYEGEQIRRKSGKAAGA